MLDNTPVHVYVATELAAAICANSLQVNDYRPDGLKSVAENAVTIYRAVHAEVVAGLNKPHTQ